MQAFTGVRGDLVRLAELYGVPGERVTRIEATLSGVTFWWRDADDPRVEHMTALPLDQNPPGHAAQRTPIYEVLAAEQ